MLTNGDSAPDFTLPGVPSDRSSGIERYTLSEEYSSGPVLLNFYLFDFNPQCRENVCDLHDLSWFDLDTDIGVFGISTDSTFSHREFADQENLEFPLLSDSDGTVADDYGVLADEINSHRRVANRSVFLVGRDGAISYAWSADDPRDQPDWMEIKDAIESIK